MFDILLTTFLAQKPVHSAIIDTRANKLCLVADNVHVTCMPVATGKPGFATLQGKHRVQQKVYRPSWQNFRTGAVSHWPNTPLGDYWLGFVRVANGWQGMHVLDQGIGSNASHGCVRLRANDASKVWQFLQIGDEVKVCQGCLLTSHQP